MIGTGVLGWAGCIVGGGLQTLQYSISQLCKMGSNRNNKYQKKANIAGDSDVRNSMKISI